MTRLFLAAGVAALAIASAASAKPGGGNGGGHGGGGGGAPQAQQGGGGGGGHGHGGGGGGPQFSRGGRGGAPFQMHGGGGGGGQHFAQPRQERPQMQRFAQPRQERQQFRAQRVAQARNHGFEHQQMRAQRMEVRNRGIERQQMRAERTQQVRNERQLRANRMQQAQNRSFERQQMRANRVEQARNGFDQRQLDRQQSFAREQLRGDRMRQAQNFDRNRFRVNEDYANRYYGVANARGLYDGCPPGLAAKNNGCLPPGQAAKFLGAPLSAVAGYSALSALPSGWNYLYPETQDYYYRYGDGYLYQVDRNTNLIDNLLPLLAGGYMPGTYLPQPYMASYVPDYYGLNSFYPDYGDTCNRYGNGVIYEVDCASGMVEDVIPLYAGGYGVGQILPASYSYYNVPYQYRDMYYDTPDHGYWYAPGAIYQYDRGNSMITSVAALMSPGFAVGQSLPYGYDAYNVPYAYRDTYYDTPTAWYRYNNGYIYQVDPVTRLVTSIVASLLT
ncbi:hypothetical protein [Sphingomonas limnosediminicola]